jgi:hypothetical protein
MLMMGNGRSGGKVDSDVTKHWVAIADGDDVGRLLDGLAASNDLDGLVSSSRALDLNREQLADWFAAQGATVVLNVADTVVAMGETGVLFATRPTHFPSWSVGVGRDLRGAHAALAVAKATGKDRIIDGRDWRL